MVISLLRLEWGVALPIVWRLVCVIKGKRHAQHTLSVWDDRDGSESRRLRFGL